MEKNMKSQDIQKNIDKLFKSNPKIPFMQSKDILKFGYQHGYDYCIEQTKNVLKSEKPATNDKSSINKCFIEKEVEAKIKLDAYNSILIYIKNHQDLMDVYNELKNRTDQLRQFIPVNRRR